MGKNSHHNIDSQIQESPLVDQTRPKSDHNIDELQAYH
jgi:hypothetical protein